MNWFKKLFTPLKPCPEEVSDAVLGVLFPIFNGMPSDVTVYCNSYDKSVLMVLDDHEKEIFRIRTWAKETPMSSCFFKEYNNWLDYYQNRINETREEMRTHARQKSHEEFDRQQREENKRREAFILTNAVPRPPARNGR